WFDRRNPDALNAYYLIQCFHQVKEFVFPLTVPDSKITQVYTGKHYFFYSAFCNLPCAVYNILYRVAPASPSCQRYCTVSTWIITPVLDFKEGSGPVTYGIGCDKIM